MEFGYVTVELTSASVTRLLQKIADSGIDLMDVGSVDGLRVRLNVDRRNLSKLRVMCQSQGATVKVLRTAGMIRMARRVLSRPVLIIGALFLLILTLFLPTRILFIEVEGAQMISPRMILAYAEECGVSFGTDRRQIRSEKVKNAILEAMPQLEWVGINTYGCRAVISVRERTQVSEGPITTGISSLVAIRDGVISEMTVLKGNPVCRIGQSVTKGQVLISGYTDLGICIHGTQAEGEVYAETQRTLEVLTLAENSKKATAIGQNKKFSLIIGKNRINFFKGSGISGTSCDKMYSYHYLTLPGGFRLPITLVVEKTIAYETATVTQNQKEVTQHLCRSAQAYLKEQMIAGRIDVRYEIVTPMKGIYYQIGKYACHEMISRPRPEEDLQGNEID